MYNKSLFIFRRDLRISDNTALIAATDNSRIVIPCFIFDPRQLGSTNHYRSTRCAEFMIQALDDLFRSFALYKGKLFFFEGTPEDVIHKIHHHMRIDAVYLNHDYTPFSSQRDRAIEQLCKQSNIHFHAYHDALLHAPSEVLKKDGLTYVKFTPFYDKASSLSIDTPQQPIQSNYFNGQIPGSYTLEHIQKLCALTQSSEKRSGRSAGLRLLERLPLQDPYEQCHDIPAADCTTQLSAHLKFTTVSIREVYHTLRASLQQPNTLLRQLYWRDFFTHIAAHFPHVFSSSFKRQYATIMWEDNQQTFLRWCEGTTGFPLVDAGMRQLAETGWMHNRARLVTASFLVKDLHQNWQRGEQFFAQSLVDYDPAVNNGNWQWVAGTGCDSQPYFRIFNPWLQQKKFDPACAYIKRWVPELRTETATTIHLWYNTKKRPHHHAYPKPMVDHAEAAAQFLKLFKH